MYYLRSNIFEYNTSVLLFLILLFSFLRHLHTSYIFSKNKLQVRYNKSIEEIYKLNQNKNIRNITNPILVKFVRPVFQNQSEKRNWRWIGTVRNMGKFTNQQDTKNAIFNSFKNTMQYFRLFKSQTGKASSGYTFLKWTKK